MSQNLPPCSDGYSGGIFGGFFAPLLACCYLENVCLGLSLGDEQLQFVGHGFALVWCVTMMAGGYYGPGSGRVKGCGQIVDK